MAYLVLIVVTFLASTLTFFTGFGLGTLLLPVFLLFFPTDIAIAATAIVHLASNLAKALLIGRHANGNVLLRFGLPAAVTAIAGALLLNTLTHMPSLFRYSVMGHSFEVTPIKLLVGMLMGVFAALELSPRFQALSFAPQWLPVGGMLSGFFGGLTGHQGALRSAFLIRLNMEKQVFLGTVALAAIMVDVARLAVYGVTFVSKDFGLLLSHGHMGLFGAGCAAALAGNLLGTRFIHKVTLETIRLGIGVLLVGYALALGAGLI